MLQCLRSLAVGLLGPLVASEGNGGGTDIFRVFCFVLGLLIV